MKYSLIFAKQERSRDQLRTYRIDDSYQVPSEREREREAAIYYIDSRSQA